MGGVFFPDILVLYRNNVDHFGYAARAVVVHFASGGKANNPIVSCVEGVIFADAATITSKVGASCMAYDNINSSCRLTVMQLHATLFWL